MSASQSERAFEEETEFRVLHVDDEREFAEMVAEFLEAEDSRITAQTATSGAAGLERLADADIDCVISDYDMHRMNGIEFLEAVREDYPEMPFILFTGKGSEEVASEAISAGVTDYLQKERDPNRYTLLANRIVNAVQRRRASAELAETKDRYRALREELIELSVELFQSERMDIDRRIERGLERIGSHVGADRSYVFQLDDGGETVSNTQEWCAEGVTPQIESLQNLPVETVPWWMRKLEQFEMITVPDVSELPAEADAEREILEEQNIRALIVAPMITEDELVGFVGFDWVEKHERWSDEFIDILQIAGKLITSAIQRESRRRELERREAYLEQSGDIISVIDATGEIKYQSESTEQVTGFAPTDVVGQSGFEHIHPEDLETIETLFPSFVSQPGEEITAELRVEAKSGGWRWVEVQGVNRLEDPVIEGLLFSSREITERKEREQEIRRQNNRLNEFAGFVSHDLRNPLNVAQGRIALAREECNSEHLDAAADGIERSFELIEELLVLARSNKAIGEREPVELAPLAETCWETVETADARILTVVDSTVRADRSRLRQLLENIFRNMIEHGGEDVTVEIGSLDGGFYIEDDGPGIAPDKREDVFEMGYSENKGGTGFGLTIVQQIAEAHGWAVGITDGSNGGARFEITGVETALD